MWKKISLCTGPKYCSNEAPGTDEIWFGIVAYNINYRSAIYCTNSSSVTTIRILSESDFTNDASKSKLWLEAFCTSYFFSFFVWITVKILPERKTILDF